MQSLQALFDEYAESHQNPTNKLIHYACVPAIYFAVVGLLCSISVTIAVIVAALALVYYCILSLNIAFGMLIVTLVCFWIALSLQHLLIASLIVFVLAWIGQFIGHKIEGKKPSFFKDLQFLLIGPAWILAHIFRHFKISY